MKFVRITPQLAVNAHSIERAYISGHEDLDNWGKDIQVRLKITGDDTPCVYRRAKTFREAEALLEALLTLLEA